MAWLFTGGSDEKQAPKSHHAFSPSSRYSCNLSHSYLISTRVSGQTNVLLISSLLLPKWGRAARERAGQQGVRSRD